MGHLSRRRVLQSGSALLLANSFGVTAGSASLPDAIARLDRNENPFGPSPRVKASLAGLAEQACRYPYEEVAVLRTLIAECEGVRPENIYVSEGSAEVLKLAAILYGAPGRQIIAARPTFPMLPQYAELRGAGIGWVDVDEGFDHDFAAMRAKVDEDTSLIYVCNPNNPTGSLADPWKLRAFIHSVSPQALVVVDEAYIDYVSEPQRTSVVDQVKAGANVLITRSFSKLYGLAGLRIGYGIAKVEIIRQFESMRMSFPNVAGVTAARASLGDVDFRTDMCRQTAQSRDFVSRLFGERRIRHVPSHANFVMFDTGAAHPGFVEFARPRGVMLAPVTEPFETWVRVSMGRPENMQAFAHVLQAFLERA